MPQNFISLESGPGAYFCFSCCCRLSSIVQGIPIIYSHSPLPFAIQSGHCLVFFHLDLFLTPSLSHTSTQTHKSNSRSLGYDIPFVHLSHFSSFVFNLHHVNPSFVHSSSFFFFFDPSIPTTTSTLSSSLYSSSVSLHFLSFLSIISPYTFHRSPRNAPSHRYDRIHFTHAPTHTTNDTHSNTQISTQLLSR